MAGRTTCGAHASESLVLYRSSVPAKLFRRLAATKALRAKALDRPDIGLAPVPTTKRTQESLAREGLAIWMKR